MKLDKIIFQIESVEYSLEIGLCGSRSKLRDAVINRACVSKLIDMLKSSDVVAERIAGRAIRISNLPIDKDYQNPHDIALATYLIALYETHPVLARSCATVVGLAPNLWWSIPYTNFLDVATGSDSSDSLLAYP